MDFHIEPDDQRTLNNISEHGWSGIIIEADHEGPGFEYTVGLMATECHPEIIVFGLPSKRSHDTLWTLVEALRSGVRFDAPGRHQHVFEGVPSLCRPVHPSQHNEYMGVAVWHRRFLGSDGTLRAVQCLWPDEHGKFPGEVGCAQSVEALQPDLSRRRIE